MIRLESSTEADVLWQLSMWHLCGGQIHILGLSVFTSSAAGKKKKKTNKRQILCNKHGFFSVPFKCDYCRCSASGLLHLQKKTSNFIFVMIIKNTASPTTGLCTSQKALSWLSRIFRSILSLFLSTLGKTRRAELFWQSWSRYEPLTLERELVLPACVSGSDRNLLCLCFCLHKNKFPFPGEGAL